MPCIGTRLRIGIAKGLLALPLDPNTLVICVGPGTGVVPAHAVLEACVYAGARDNTLYFGHRASGKDAHYSHEWTTLAESGKLTYHVTVSRDGLEGTRRIYMQDLISAAFVLVKSVTLRLVEAATAREVARYVKTGFRP